MPTCSCAYVFIGALRQDFLVTAEGRAGVGLPGGEPVYAAAGARVWADSVGVLGRVGRSYPAALLQALEAHGIGTDGIHRTDEEIDPRRFLAYLQPDRPVASTPAAHFLRAGLPLPKELIGFQPQEEPAALGLATGDAACRVRDLPAFTSPPRAAHLCPADAASQLLIPARLRELGVPLITLDPAPAPFLRGDRAAARQLLAGLDAVLLSLDQAMALFRPDAPSPWEIAESLAETGCRIVVLKAGAGGQWLFDRTGAARWRVPAYPSTVRDRTGAGDAFCGGFLVGLERTGDPLEAALHGSAAASLVVEGSGPFYALEALPGLAKARREALRPGVRRG